MAIHLVLDTYAMSAARPQRFRYTKCCSFYTADAAESTITPRYVLPLVMDRVYHKIIPSVMSHMNQDGLWDVIRRTGAFKHSPKNPFVLASGAHSPYYYDMRMVTADPDGLYLAAERLLPMMAGSRSVGGLEAGAIPLAAAVSMLSRNTQMRLSSFYVRKNPKTHGTQKLIEGTAVGPAAIVDDVITTGGSALRAATALQDVGITCSGIYCILFRGTDEDLNTISDVAPLRHIFTHRDFEINKKDQKSSL